MQALQQQDLSALVDNHPRAIMLSTTEPRIAYVNRMFRSVTGYQAEEVVAVQYSGAELEIGFNVSYLLDVLAVLEQPQVRLSLSDEASSALLEHAESPAEQEPERLYVVMPMRL